MFGVEGTSSLHFATNAKMIGSGLDEQLEKFIRERSDTKLKQFADRYGVCILIVRHTRKQPAWSCA